MISPRTTISTCSHVDALYPNREVIPKPIIMAPITRPDVGSINGQLVKSAHDSILTKYQSPKTMDTMKWSMKVYFRIFDISILYTFLHGSNENRMSFVLHLEVNQARNPLRFAKKTITIARFTIRSPEKLAHTKLNDESPSNTPGGSMWIERYAYPLR